tara:strand:- start:24 stop:1076 length:1053 start_codon:yes stop_codon:yes gene_type:complete
MADSVKRVFTILLVLSIMSIPAMGMSSGPGYENSDGDPTVKYGCSCHNNGAASTRAVVMVTGVPVMYEIDQSYDMTIKVADSLTLSGGDGNTEGGFLMTSDGIGKFSWPEDEDIREAEDAPSDISHSETDSDGIWQITWTAPSNDTGHVHFWVAGNSVNGDGAPGDDDWWNVLSFTINSPDTIESGDSGATLETRTVSVGDYDTLFLIEESEAQREAERQEALSHRVFTQGNLFFWTSLTALLVGALVQREILERKYDDGPEFLATELAYPQALRRALMSIASFLIAIRWASSETPIYFPPPAVVEEGTKVTDLTAFLTGSAFLASALFAYGVYRTILAAKVSPDVKDRL